MTGALIAAIVSGAIQFGLPAIGALLNVESSVADEVLAQELDAYRKYRFAPDQGPASRLRAALARQVPLVKPAIADMLSPVFSCRTPWQCDMAVALAKSKIHEGP